MYGGGCGSTREGEDKKEEETSVRTKMRRQTAYTQRARAMSHHRSKLCNLADWCSLDALRKHLRPQDGLLEWCPVI